jgi:hypothetical protein
MFIEDLIKKIASAEQVELAKILLAQLDEAQAATKQHAGRPGFDVILHGIIKNTTTH